MVFGIVSLLEMQMLRIVREAYPCETWKELLKEKRIEAAVRILELRKKSNEEIDLADCLQFCDKRDIILGNKQILEALNLGSKGESKKFFTELEELRNNLAHSQDIKIEKDWRKTLGLAKSAEDLLNKFESISFLGEETD